MASYPILPDNIRSARESDYSDRPFMIQLCPTPRRRFWLEFSVLPHYPSKRALKTMRRLEKKHRGKDKTSNDYDLHDVPAVRFPQFGRLPPEIRLVIWEYALCQPRIIVVTSKYEDYTPPIGTTLNPLSPTNYNYQLTGIQSPVLTSLPPLSPPPPPWKPPPAELPALMATCRESYECAIKFYERAFDWRVPHVLVDDDVGDDAFVATRGYYAGSALGFFGQSQSASTDSSSTHGQDGQQDLQTQNLPPLSSVLGSRYRVQPGSTPVQRPAAKRARPSGPGCWFNFDYDSIFLKGALEPCLEAASTSMVYFMPQTDTKRVRYVACNAEDLGVGELMANQLYARLFPVIDRFEIKKCLNVVSPPRIHHRRSSRSSRSRHPRPDANSSDSAAAAEVLTTAANIAVTQRNPSGTGYDDQGRPRLNDTQASCMAVHAADLNQYSGDMNGLDSYDMSNNVCQQVWDQWTNSQSMASRKTMGRHRHRHSGGNRRGSGSASGSYLSDSDSDSSSGSDSETSSCFCDIEGAISAEPKLDTRMSIDDEGEDDGEDEDGEGSDSEDGGEVSADHTATDGLEDADNAENAEDMDVDVNESPDGDAMPVMWPPLGWDAMAAPNENYEDAALHDQVQNGQDRDVAPTQESMRIVMVTEDLLQGTIATIEKVQRYASKLGTRV